MTLTSNQEENHIPPSTQTGSISRRRFLGQAGAMAAGAGALSAMQLNFDAVQAAAAANPDSSGYKALVCILLAGGNDSFNMLVPDRDHAAYVAARGGLRTSNNGGVALPKSDLTTIGTDGRFLLHNSLPDMANLYDGNDLAFLANAGPLVTPLVSANRVEPLTIANTPRGLFSHSDQINAWQVVGGQGTGAMGRVADVYYDPNDSGLSAIGGSISVAGTNLMQRGAASRHYTLASNGPVVFDRSGTDASRSLTQIYNAIGAVPNAPGQNAYNSTYPGRFKQAYATHMREAVANAAAYSAGYSATKSGSSIANGVFNPNNPTSAQLEVVARSIEMQSTIATQDRVSRQVFFVLLGGWDDHSALIRHHGPRLSALNEALNQFRRGLQAIGRWDDVVTFTVSDFGRTLRSNGTGTDHGWGGNHMIMGGSVKGGRVYGSYPTAQELTPGGRLDTAKGSHAAGRMIPTTSADEYIAELAQWFGVPTSRLTEVVPNLGRFYTPRADTTPLGFLN
jgi:uncharacterized protein (DUF1501 family)